ncbi:hypothetical protein D3C79_564400 [compost metagenome]
MQRGNPMPVNQRQQLLRIAVRFRRRHHQLGPHHQRPEKLPHRDVKAAWRFLQHHIVRRQWILMLHPQQTVDDRLMPHQYAFRPPGRTGSKDDVSRVMRRWPVELHLCRAVGGQRRIKQQDLSLAGKTRLLGRFGDDQSRCGIFQHHAEAFVRVAGVQRQVGGPRFDNRHQRQRQEHRARQRNGNDIAGLYPLCRQLACQRGDLFTGFAIAEPVLRVPQRRGVRGFLRLFGQQAAEGLRRHRMSGVVNPGQQLAVLFGQQIGFANRHLRPGGKLTQQQRQTL